MHGQTHIQNVSLFNHQQDMFSPTIAESRLCYFPK